MCDGGAWQSATRRLAGAFLLYGCGRAAPAGWPRALVWVCVVAFISVSVLTGLSVGLPVPALGRATAGLDKPVPWSPTPATAPTTTSLARPGTGRARVLAAGQPSGGVGAGSAYWSVPLADKGSTPCSLPSSGYGLTAVGPRGRQISLLTTKTGSGAVVEAGQVAQFVVQETDHCNPAGTVLPHEQYHALLLHLPTGNVRLGRLHLLLCTPHVYTSLQTSPPARPPPGTTASLQARIAAPATVTTGTGLHFVVVLSNPSGVAAHFEACPVYTEGLYLVRAGVRSEGTFRLDCAGARTIAQHSQVSFAMVVSVPSIASLRSAGDAAKLYWRVDSSGPPAGAVVVVMPERERHPGPSVRAKSKAAGWPPPPPRRGSRPRGQLPAPLPRAHRNRPWKSRKAQGGILPSRSVSNGTNSSTNMACASVPLARLCQ